MLRLTPAGSGGGGQGTPTLNRPATTERSNCLEKSFVFGPGPSLAQQIKVATQAQPSAPPPPSETTGENAGKFFGPCAGQPLPQGPPQQLAPPQPPQVRPGGRGQDRLPPTGPPLGARGESVRKVIVFGSGQLSAHQAKEEEPPSWVDPIAGIATTTTNKSKRARRRTRESLCIRDNTVARLTNTGRGSNRAERHTPL